VFEVVRSFVHDVVRALRSPEPHATRKGGREILIGLASSGHDGAVATIDGERVFAEALERSMQCKRAVETLGMHYATRSLQRFLGPCDDATISFRTTWNRDPAPLFLSSGLIASLPRKLQRRAFLDVKSATDGFEAGMIATEPVFARKLAATLRGASYAPRTDDVQTIDHHLAHAALAVHSSPFEECAVLVVDGWGDRGSVSAYEYGGGEFRLLDDRVSYDSLGWLYAFVTDLCGFDAASGEEWKVMGLAAYGKRDERLHRFFADRVRIDGLHVALALEPDWVDRLKQLVRLRRPGEDPLIAADLAHNFQRAFEEALFELARALHRATGSPNLAYAGGCALNSSANGKLLSRTPFERLHVPCAPADDGTSLGALLYERRLRLDTPYLGSEPDDEELDRILSFGGLDCEHMTDPSERIAELLTRGAIVGVMNARAELGPRALGNRSILADPRDPGMKDRINARVKFREAYRPLSPSILHEHGPQWFEDYCDAPYMERALRFREDVSARVPAVVHVDGTGRLQSVTEQRNPYFYRVIRAFHARTGVPLVLNTSLNVMGKPIVHSVQDAITVLMTTGLDALAIGDRLLRKR
jgi:carbamoyltransferase